MKYVLQTVLMVNVRRLYFAYFAKKYIYFVYIVNITLYMFIIKSMHVWAEQIFYCSCVYLFQDIHLLAFVCVYCHQVVWSSSFDVPACN